MGAHEFAEVISLIAPQCLVGTAALPQSCATLHDVDVQLPDGLSAEPLNGASFSPGKIMNSGGSTGRPKLIVDPEPSVWGPDKRGRRRNPRITFLNPAPLHHSAPFAYSTGAILEGSHVVCLERFDPESWLRAVETYRPAFVYLVPTMMSRIARLPAEVSGGFDLSSIETLTHMAAPCPGDVKRWWIERIGPEKVLEVYGGTERIGAAVIDGVEWLQHPGSVGKAAAGYEVLILGPDGAQLPAGEVGEIYFRADAGPAAAYSYIGSETRVRGDIDSFGDMGWVDSEGWLYIADRRTDMVLIGGANVFPAEIEAAIETLPGVLGAAVIGLPDDDMGNRLHAIVELAQDAKDPNEGRAFLAPALAGFGKLKRPASAEFTRDRLRDDTGKIRRFRLREERLTSQSKLER
jgi:bile acid-coenzyme A ligase